MDELLFKDVDKCNKFYFLREFETLLFSIKEYIEKDKL
jgi:hypothetical protein